MSEGTESGSSGIGTGYAEKIIDGLKAVWPVCFGYVPLGLALGVLGRQIGLAPIEIGFMSLLVFAGSGQFIAVSMLGAGAAPISVIATIFIVNLRHLLMSSSMAVFLKGENRLKLSAYAQTIVDETFAVNLERFRKETWDIDRALVVNFAAYFSWAISTVLGGYCGQFISEGAFGINYALIGMFICLLVFQLNGPIYVVTAIIAGFSAVVTSFLIPGNWYIIIGSIVAATAGFYLKKTGLFSRSKGVQSNV